MTKVLIPTDGSDCSKATLNWAIKTLDKANTEYHLLAVITDPMIAEYEVEDAKKIMAEYKSTLEASGCTVADMEYVMGDPAESICNYAKKQKMDQVLMGSHGRTGLAKVFLGSVSSAVMERCEVPVFLYRNVQRAPHHANVMI